MFSFILERQPKSYNGWSNLNAERKASYKRVILDSFKRFYSDDTTLSGNLYGIVYYFYKNDTGTDADNISKPFWDCLEGTLFENDKQVMLRIAGCVDISEGKTNSCNLSRFPENVWKRLIQVQNDDSIKYFVYIECGSLEDSFYRYSLEINEN